MAFPRAGLQLILQGASAFQSDLKAAGSAVNNFTKGLGSVSFGGLTSAVNAFGHAISRVATITAGMALYRISSAVVGLVPEIGRLTLAYTNQSVLLQGLIASNAVTAGSVSDISVEMARAAPVARELFNQYQKLAILSPFKTDDIIAARVTLQTYGLMDDQLKTLVPRLVDVGTLRGWDSQKMHQAALALGQVAANGRLMGQEANQLAGVAIPAYRMVADALGISTREAMKLGREGKIGAEQFFEIFMKWSESAAGASERFADTLPGLVSSVQDLREINLREFGLGFGETIIPVLKDLVTWLNDPAIQQGFHDVGVQLGEATISAIDWGRSIVSAFGHWQNGIISLRTVADTVLPGLGDHFGLILSGVEKVIPWVEQRLPEAMDFLREHSHELMGALSAIQHTFLAGLGIQIVIGLLGTLLSPIGLVTSGIGILGAAWAGNWGGIQEKTAEVWSELQPMLQELGVWFEQNLPVAIQTVSDVWKNNLLPAISEFGTFLTDTALPKLKELGDWFELRGPPIIEAMGRLWNEVLLPALQTVGGVLGDIVIPKLGELIDKFAAGLPGAIDTFIAKWNGEFLPAMESFGQHVDEEWAPSLDRFGTAFGEAFTRAWSVIGPILETLGSVAAATFGVIVSLLETGLIAEIDKASKKLEDFSAGFDILTNGFMDGATRMVGGVAQWVGGIEAGTRTVAILLTSLVAEWLAGWERMKAGVVTAAAQITATIASKLVEWRNNFTSAGAQLVATVVSNWNSINNTIASIAAQITGVIAGKLNEWRGIVEGAMASIKSIFSSAWNEAKSIVDGAVNAIGGMVSKLGGFFDSIAGAASRLVGKLREIASAIASIAIPDWALGRSPPPLAEWFDYIGESVFRVAEEALPALQRSLEATGEDVGNMLEQWRDAYTDFTVGGFTATAGIERQKVRNVEDLEDVDPKSRDNTKQLLLEAERFARQIADPEKAAAYFRDRSREIFELADLQTEANKVALDAEEKRKELLVEIAEATKKKQLERVAELKAEYALVTQGEKEKLAALKEQYEYIVAAQEAEERARAISISRGSDLQKLISQLEEIFTTVPVLDNPALFAVLELLRTMQASSIANNLPNTTPTPYSAPVTTGQALSRVSPPSVQTSSVSYNYNPSYASPPRNEPQRSFDVMRTWGL